MRAGDKRMNNKEYSKICKIFIDLINHAISLNEAIKTIEDMQD